MAPFTKPETVIKQAEGLISVGQTRAALQSLTEMFSSKKFRMTPLASLEPIMLRFLELCVNLRKGRIAKEGLMQYKNIAQNSNVTSIEVVVKKFIQLADAKVQEAQEQADKVATAEIDDLEASEIPEDILLRAVSGDQSKDRTDRALVTPWLRFLWEGYRNVLETLKNNARVEIIYQQIANQAFKFCLKHGRKVEFRRLCEILRLHLSNVAKYSHQPHSINLTDQDTLQRHLDTRFAQLNTSVELELWQEAFRSVEDIHNLLTMAKKAPKPTMMANYYEKLTKIFLMSGNALYHAAAWNRYYNTLRTSGVKTEELSKLAGQVLISVLAIPIGQSEDVDENKSKNARLTALLGMSKTPTRSALLKEALSRHTLKLAPESIQQLHEILEVTFHPLTICATITPVFRELSVDPAYAAYLPLLHRVLLSRLFSQLSQVYSSVRITHVLELVEPLNHILPEDAEQTTEEDAPPKLLYNRDRVEAFVMGCAQRGELPVRINHSEGSISFVTDTFASSSSSTASTSQASPTAHIRTRLTRLASALSVSLLHIDPPEIPDPLEQFAELAKYAEAERKRLSIRRTLTSRRDELLSELSARKEKEEQSRRAENSRREKELESKRQAENLRKKEQERIQKEVENARREEAITLAKAMMSKGGLKNVEDIESLDTTRLVEIQVEQMDKEKRELSERLRVVTKRIDHIERAIRQTERPLIEQGYEDQKKNDLIAFKESQKATLLAVRQKHAEDMAAKSRMSRMLEDYRSHRTEIGGKREEEFKRKQEVARKKMEEEIQKRRREVLAERERERQRIEEEERQQREEEAERQRKEEERLAEERRQEEEKKEKEEAERRKKEEEEEKAAEARRQRQKEREEAAEAARRQREREEEALARRTRRAEPEKEKPKPNGGEEGVWRRPTPVAQPQPVSASTATPGKYRPGAFGGAAGGAAAPSTGGWREREARKTQAPAPTSQTPPPAAAPATPKAADADGFTTVSKPGVWKPKHRGAGEAPPR